MALSLLQKCPEYLASMLLKITEELSNSLNKQYTSMSLAFCRTLRTDVAAICSYGDRIMGNTCQCAKLSSTNLIVEHYVACPPCASALPPLDFALCLPAQAKDTRRQNNTNMGNPIENKTLRHWATLGKSSTCSLRSMFTDHLCRHSSP